MTRTDRISANVGRLLAPVWADTSLSAHGTMLDNAMTLALAIEDAVDAAERDYKGLPSKSEGLGDETPERWRKGGCV